MSGLTRILNEKLIVEKFLLLGKVELEEQRIAKAERFLRQQSYRAHNRVLAIPVCAASWKVMEESCSL